MHRNVIKARDRAIFFEQETAFRAVEYRAGPSISPVLRCLFILPTGTSRVASYHKSWKVWYSTGNRQSEIRRLHADARL